MEYKIISSTATGEINYDDFEKQLEKNRDAIFIASFGTIMTSAKDNINSIKNIFEKYAVNHYIHADAALDGMIIPFVKTNIPFKLSQGVDSISISGHKLIGSPIPCGVALIHKSYVKKNTPIEYIKSFDCTVSGSRAGLAALILWYAIKTKKRAGFAAFVNASLERAANYSQLFNDANIPAWRFEDAITIVLPKQSSLLTKKWRLPSDARYTTLTALPKLTLSMVEEFIKDIEEIKTHGHLKDTSKGIIFSVDLHDISLEDC